MMKLSTEKEPCTEFRALGLNQVKQIDQFQAGFFPRFNDDSTNQRITFPTSLFPVGNESAPSYENAGAKSIGRRWSEWDPHWSGIIAEGSTMPLTVLRIPTDHSGSAE